MTHLRADHQFRDTVHHGDCCFGDGTLLVPISPLQPEREIIGAGVLSLCISNVLEHTVTGWIHHQQLLFQELISCSGSLGTVCSYLLLYFCVLQEHKTSKTSKVIVMQQRG